MMLKRTGKRQRMFLLAALGIVVAALAALCVFAFPDQTAAYLWRQWRAGSLALVLDKSDAPLAMQIGNYYFGTVPIGDSQPAYDPSLAAHAFDKALAIQPGILWGHYDLARIYFAQGDFADALAQINDELAANPANLRSLYVRGLIYGFRDLPGDLSLAENDLTRFTQWAPTEWAGYNDLSWILLQEGKYQDVIAVIKAASQKVANADQNPWLLNDKGLAYLNLGDDRGAAAAFTEALAAADSLTDADWRAAYSGDAPSSDQQGLAAFKSGIQANLQKAQKEAQGS